MKGRRFAGRPTVLDQRLPEPLAVVNPYASSLTFADASFYMHELTESTLMRQGMDYEAARIQPEYARTTYTRFAGLAALR